MHVSLGAGSRIVVVGVLLQLHPEAEHVNISQGPLCYYCCTSKLVSVFLYGTALCCVEISKVSKKYLKNGDLLENVVNARKRDHLTYTLQAE